MTRNPRLTPLGGVREGGEAAEMDLTLVIQDLTRLQTDSQHPAAARAVAEALLPRLRGIHTTWAAHLQELNRLVAEERKA